MSLIASLQSMAALADLIGGEPALAAYPGRAKFVSDAQTEIEDQIVDHLRTGQLEQFDRFDAAYFAAAGQTFVETSFEARVKEQMSAEDFETKVTMGIALLIKALVKDRERSAALVD